VRSASGSPRSFPGTSAASPRVLRLLETRTPHEGHGLANALRHVLKRPDLAAEVEALLPDDGGERYRQADERTDHKKAGTASSVATSVP
jgi:hypothetical protein